MKKTAIKDDPKYSPIKQAELILKELSEHISKENKKILDETNFSLVIKLLSNANVAKKNSKNNKEVEVIFAIKGYCESAKEHCLRGDVELAIWTLSDAKYYLGALVGLSKLDIAQKLDFSNKTYYRDDRKQKRVFFEWMQKQVNCHPKNVKQLIDLIKRSDKKVNEILKDVTDATLREWAKEAGLIFQKGRPKKNN